MRINNYLNNEENNPTQENPTMKILPDGRRTKENLTKIQCEDGSEEVIKEILEEVVPMRVSKIIRTKVAQVPVEEKIETISENGEVQTEVRTLNQNLLNFENKTEKSSTIEELANEVKSLKQMLAKTVVNTKSNKENVWLKAKAKYEPKVKQTMAEEIAVEPVKQKEDWLNNPWVSTTAWIVFLIILGIATYTLL